MKQVALGQEGLFVSRLGVSCMGLSDPTRKCSENDWRATLHASLDAGISLVDTANRVGATNHEARIAKVIKERRDGVVLAVHCQAGAHAATETEMASCRPEDIQSACEASLRRLKIDVIDIYCFRFAGALAPIEAVMGVLSSLVEQGKVRYLALEQPSVEHVERAHRTYPLSAVFAPYSLWCRKPERRLLPLLRGLGIGLVACSPLGAGMLTGETLNDDEMSEVERLKRQAQNRGEMLDQSLHLTKRLDEMAAQGAPTSAQLALAWLLAQGDDVVPAFSTQKRMRVIENIGAVRTSLSAQQRDTLRSLAPGPIQPNSRSAAVRVVSH